MSDRIKIFNGQIIHQNRIQSGGCLLIENGKIVDAQAVQAPSGSNDRYTQKAVPRLREQTIAAQSANVQGVSGASFTSYGWYTSLASAIAKAGL